jgi:hypothetical protein
MKVIVRSSSLLFFFVNLLLGLPVHRRPRSIGVSRAVGPHLGTRAGDTSVLPS